MKKVVIIIFLLAGLFGGASLLLGSLNKGNVYNKDLLTPISKEGVKIVDKIFPKSTLEKDPYINILLIGNDSSANRISSGQTGYNTDSMILVSANTETNKVLLISVPRDLWINGNKINALYTVYGSDTLVNAYEKIIGQEVDGYIMTNFDDFEWIVDSFGGVPINVETTFQDSSFPNRDDTDVMTVSFEQGTEKMSGERALVFARSRKGTNGEGSDLMRAKRQHLILKGMIEAIKQPESLFWPFDGEKFLNMVTTVRNMETTLNVLDVEYLWDFYEDKDLYTIDSLVIGDEYIYHPGMYPDSAYTAWVFIPRDETFTQLHADIVAKLNGTFVEEVDETDLTKPETEVTQ